MVSRPTISISLNRLAKEGYIETRQGAGAYVCATLQTGARATSKIEAAGRSFGATAEAAPVATPVSSSPELERIDFSFLVPALEQFPLEEWGRALGRQLRSRDQLLMLNAHDPGGNLSLRAAISGFVERTRGISCRPEQVIIMSGLNQAISLVSSMRLVPGSRVVMENPGYWRARNVFRFYGAEVFCVSVDKEGLNTSSLKQLEGTPFSLLYVTPSRQFPTGTTMSLSRRLELLDFAQNNDLLILEDDYDSEYDPEGHPVPALTSLDRESTVVYLGTLGQLMFPSVGLGYLIVPPNLVQSYSQGHSIFCDAIPHHLQAAAADFIDQGHLDRHIKRLKVIYSQRRSLLLAALHESFGSRVTVTAEKAGVFVIAKFQTDLAAEDIGRKLLALNVGLINTAAFYDGAAPQNEFIIGFGNLTDRLIKEGIARLARIFN